MRPSTVTPLRTSKDRWRSKPTQNNATRNAGRNAGRTNGRANEPVEQLPPDDRETEKQVLGAAMQPDWPDSAVFVRKMQRSDFYLSRHQLILAAIQAVMAEGTVPDIHAVGLSLLDNHQLDQAGGSSYLAELVDGVVTGANTRHHIEHLRLFTVRRQSFEIGKALVQASHNGHDAAALRDLVRPLLEVTHAAVVALKPDQVLRQTRAAGEPIPTGVKALDERFRGGIRPGKVVAIGGQPYVGKTSLALQIALNAAKAGCIVRCLCPDEGPEGASIRLGQQLGVKREDLEDNVGDALDHMEQSFADLDILFPDPDEETLEGMIESLVAEYPEQPKLVVLDSIQNVRTEYRSDNIRERVGETARIAHRLARRHGLVVLFTSELNRGSYRSKRPQDRNSDMAAFAESRLEYTFDAGLIVDPNTDDHLLVEVRLPKNRLALGSSRQSFLLRLDPARARFEAVEDDQRASGRPEDKQVNKATEGILRQLQETPGLSRTELYEAVGGNKKAFDTALLAARESGIVVTRQGKKRNRVEHILAEVPTGTNTDQPRPNRDHGPAHRQPGPGTRLI
jgi:replicative DNA helicase